MALSIASAVVNNSGSGNETAAASGSTSLANATAIAGSALVALGIYVQMTINASATAGAIVKVFAGYDSTHFSTYAVAEYDVPATTTGAVSCAFSVLPGHAYYKVVVYNLSASYTLTGIYVRAAPQVLS